MQGQSAACHIRLAGICEQADLVTASLVAHLLTVAYPLLHLPIRVEAMMVPFCDLTEANETCVAVSVISIPEADP